MIPPDLGWGLLAGLLSFLTPEALFLLPLTIASAAAPGRADPVAGVLGVAASLVAGGLAAGWLGARFGLDARWLRHGVGVLLILLGLVLLSATLTRRFRVLTGGSAVPGEQGSSSVMGGIARHFLLFLLVGLLWLPRLTPVLGKATLIAAAETPQYTLGLEILFAFALGAALPWALLGQIVRMIPERHGGGITGSMMGKRILGLALLAVAGASVSGTDVALVRTLNALLPNWAGTLATRY